jgi:hypothetical protein
MLPEVFKVLYLLLSGIYIQAYRNFVIIDLINCAYNFLSFKQYLFVKRFILDYRLFFFIEMSPEIEA